MQSFTDWLASGRGPTDEDRVNAFIILDAAKLVANQSQGGDGAPP